MAIKILETALINRIAAGEVVANPASVVKELLDNSIDAGATKINVEISNGGIRSIIVSDNGCGIEPNDIELAFMPHSTSKICKFEDLDAITTLGFRGEALASIVAVSQTTINSRNKKFDYGMKLDIDAGLIANKNEVGMNVGTTIEVRNLFYNTPARFKFLKKPYQEENEITNVMLRYILSNPTIEFSYSADKKIVYRHDGSTLNNAISCVYGNETTQNILEVKAKYHQFELSGYVGKLGYSKPNSTYQTLIVNGRYVIDPLISRAVFSACEDYLMTRQYPFYILNFTLSPKDVDVNVTPNKANVKFANPSMVFNFVYGAIKDVIFGVINPANQRTAKPEQKSNYVIDEKSKSINNETPSAINIKETNSATEKTNEQKVVEIIPEVSLSNNQRTLDSKINIQHTNDIFNFNKANEHVENIAIFEQQVLKNNDNSDSSYVNISDFSDYKQIGVAFNEFLVLEKGNSLVLLDFHAGHERLLYDRFKMQLNDANIAIQDLLVPYVHSMTPIEVDYIMQFEDYLQKIGFCISLFGKNEIKISSVPVLFKDINLKNFVNDMLADMKTYKPNMSREINEYLAQKACKSAVKAGMTLNETEVKSLLKNLDIKKPALLCPHGRPIVTVIDKSQIEKWFKRIV